jgi:hypothetical protein
MVCTIPCNMKEERNKERERKRQREKKERKTTNVFA